MNETRAHFNLAPVPLEDVYNNPGHSIRDFFPQHFGKQHRQAQIFFKNTFANNAQGNLRTFDHVHDLLEVLHARGIYLAVVSNKEGPQLRLEANALNMEKFFQKMVGSEDTPEDKPSPIPLLNALMPSRLEPGPHVWFVGDSEVDILCAQNAGCTPILVHRAQNAFEGAHNVQNCKILKEFFIKNLI